MSLRALVYNRVSDDPTGRHVSVTSQNTENRAYCEHMGWEIAGTVTDNDRSASRHAVREREGYREVQTALAGETATYGRVDVLVSWESARNQRDLADYVVLRDLCVTHSVLLAYKGRVYDLTRGDDRFTTGMDALLAEREADVIQDRVMRGIRFGVATGRPHGTVPFGYRRLYGENGAYAGQVADEATAPVVVEIVDRIIAGDSLYAIAADLTARGVPTPQQYKDRQRDTIVPREGWTSSKIRRLIGSRSIVGVRTHRGDPHPEPTWPPLVDVDAYELARLVLADPGRARHHRGVQVRHLLSGLVECGVCGGWLRPAKNRGADVYQCAGKGPGTGKGHVSRRKEPLEDVVVVRVVARLADPELLASLATGRGDDSAAMAARELSGLRARLAGLEDDVAEGRLTGAAFGRIEARVLAQIADAQTRATPRELPAKVRNLIGPNAGALWDAAPLEVQRQAIRSLLRVVVQRSTVPSRRFDPSSIRITPR